MSRLKRTSTVLDAARKRLAGLKAITPTPNLGPNVTEEIYAAKINSVSSRLDGYNQKLAEIDEDQNDLQKEEVELNELSRRVLAAGEGQFGPNSNEFEMLGGTRVSDRKKPSRKGATLGTVGGPQTGTGLSTP